MNHAQVPIFKQYLARSDQTYLRHKFQGVDLIDRNYSQAFQDLFVLSVLDGKKEGYFVDIGCSSPALINNTYLLEKYFGWNGVALDLDEVAIKQYSNLRNTTCYCADALEVNYAELLDNAPDQIDYLQIDVCVDDDSANNLVVLKKLLKLPKRYNVITFETNVYKVGEEIQEEGFELFFNNGYRRIAKNVKIFNAPFEDWYVDTRSPAVNHEVAQLYASNNLECDKILFLEEDGSR